MTTVGANGARPKAEAPKRRLPIRKSHIEFEGDYEGWWADVRINPPLGQWGALLSKVMAGDGTMATTGASIEAMIGLAGTMLLDWNFVDEEGEALPPSVESVGLLPLELVSALFNKTLEAVNDAPLATSNPSPNT